MGIATEIIMKILGGLIAIAGLIVIYGAAKIVDFKKLDEKKQVDPERIATLDEEQVKKFKRDAAILDVKIKGVLIAIPGFLVLLVMFKM